MKSCLAKKIIAGIVCAAGTSWYQPCVWAEQPNDEQIPMPPGGRNE